MIKNQNTVGKKPLFQQEQKFPTDSLGKFLGLCVKLLNMQEVSKEEVRFAFQHSWEMFRFFQIMKEGRLEFRKASPDLSHKEAVALIEDH